MSELGQAALDLLDPKAGERILDLGCGDGTLAVRMIDRGAEVVGIDNSPEMIDAARAKGIFAKLLDAADMDFDREFGGLVDAVVAARSGTAPPTGPAG